MKIEWKDETMEKNKIYDAKEFNNVKEIIYNSAEKFGESTAFVIKHKQDEKVSYTNISYNQL